MPPSQNSRVSSITSLETELLLTQIVARTASSVEDAKAAINELRSNLAFITMGGGFTNADFEEVRGQSSDVPWFRPLPTKPGYDGPQPQGAPPAEVVAAKFRKGIDEHLDDLKAGKGAGEIWYF